MEKFDKSLELGRWDRGIGPGAEVLFLIRAAAAVVVVGDWTLLDWVEYVVGH